MAWFLGHNGPVALGGLLLAGIGLATTAGRTVPTLDNRALPLGMLTPPALAMLVGLGCWNRLPTPARPFTRIVLARALWALVLLGFATGSALLVASAYPVLHLVAATALLVALTLGCAVVLGRGAPLVGAAGFVVLLVNTGSFRQVGAESMFLSLATQWPLVALGALCVMAYAALGSRGDTPFAG